MTTPRLALLASLTLALTAAPIVPVLAQAPPPMHGMHGGRMQHMADELGLTAAQKQRIAAIGMKGGQQMQALQANTSLTPAARMAKMRGLQQSFRTQMMAILTPAQRTKLMAMQQAQRQGQMGSRR